MLSITKRAESVENESGFYQMTMHGAFCDSFRNTHLMRCAESGVSHSDMSESGKEERNFMKEFCFSKIYRCDRG